MKVLKVSDAEITDSRRRTITSEHLSVQPRRNNFRGSIRKAHRNETQRFHTRLSVGLTVVTIALFGLLSVIHNNGSVLKTSESSFFSSEAEDGSATMTHNRSRRLDQGGGGNDNSGSYETESCHDLFEITPDRGADQCSFAKTCNNGQGLYLPFVFCGSLKPNVWFACLAPMISLWLILLFRMLGSTAEDFFSPALEMFSTKLGLPPRFAGVSLLALGNGAADVSATISAINNDPVNGYKLSLGALTGAAMVIGSVVSAMVVITAGGVPCRGALVRDATALGVAVLIVWHQFTVTANANNGMIGSETISLFLSLYCIFVVVVLLADIYHRAMVLPRLQQQRNREELMRQQAHAVSAQEALGADGGSVEPIPTSGDNSRFNRFVTALSNYDNTANGARVDSSMPSSPQVPWEGIESDDLQNDRPVLLHGAHGILNTRPHHDTDDDNEGIVDPANANGQDYVMLQDQSNLNMACVSPESLGVPAADWKEAILDGKKELFHHFHRDFVEDIWRNGDLDRFTRFLLLLEFPFSVLRKITVSIPCEGYYCRPLVALTLLLSPPWLVFYMWSNNATNILGVVFWIFWGLMAAASLAVLRLAPGGEGDMALIVATPIALYGFAVGATWIDSIANTLVAVLDFVGLCLGIPGPVVGLTILAWGNSMSDLSANVTMARKGLANMAMTACFAGPLFNILIGLGLGFSTLSARTGQSEFAVTVDRSVSTGFLFIALNSAAIVTFGLGVGGGTIPRKYGYVALILYSIYLIAALVLQYT